LFGIRETLGIFLLRSISDCEHTSGEEEGGKKVSQQENEITNSKFQIPDQFGLLSKPRIPDPNVPELRMPKSNPEFGGH
jgi:hypothetical protein